jgi:hypothetical protein
MHTVIMMAIGLIALGLFCGLAALVGRSVASGARLFFLPWLVVALLNLTVGVTHGHTIVGELPFLAIVFGVPAAIAWFIARRLAAGGSSSA